MIKDKNLTIRLNESQRDFFKSEAAKYGFSMSEFFKFINFVFYSLKDLEPDVFESIMENYYNDVYRV